MLSELIDSFIHRHYGFGNPGGKYWFIGMEEGCGDSRDELLRRFKVWDQMGRAETEDLVEYHLRLEVPYFFQEPVKLQHTWARLIRLILAAEGRPADNAAIKAYQKNYLGRSARESCLIELLPLPSPSLGTWSYGDWTGLPHLNSRKEYVQSCIHHRAMHLREMLQYHRPQVVVFYGASYRPYYEMVTGNTFGPEVEGAQWLESEGNLLLLVKHPAARGVSARDFDRIGRELRQRLLQSTASANSENQKISKEPYGIYRCERCGKLVMGYDSYNHLDQEHGGYNAEFKKIK